MDCEAKVEIQGVMKTMKTREDKENSSPEKVLTNKRIKLVRNVQRNQSNAVKSYFPYREWTLFCPDTFFP